MNLLDMSATALAAEVGAGRAAPTDVAEAARARIAELNPRINAITVVNPALAEEARQEIITLFPQLDNGNFNNFGESARVTLKPHEARMLFAQEGGVQ